MNQEVSSEDRTILAALDALERGSGEPLVPDEPTETAEMLARLYTEVLGLLPCELEPVAPRPEGRARLLAAVSGEPVARPKAQETEPRPAPPAKVSREMPAAPAPSPRVARIAAPRRRSWPLALAASLVLVLGGLCGWLLQQRAVQEVTIDALRAELEGERQKAEQAMAEATQTSQRMERMRANFSLVTAPAVTVIPLRAVGPSSGASGMLFVASDHQHWYMALHNLPPAEPGRDYQLWWTAKTGIVSGGTFDTRPGETMELSSETMPDDTRDVVITVEAEGGAPAPTGPEVLRALG